MTPNTFPSTQQGKAMHEHSDISAEITLSRPGSVTRSDDSCSIRLWLRCKAHDTDDADVQLDDVTGHLDDDVLSERRHVAWDPGPPLSLSVAYDFVRALLHRLLRDRYFVVAVPPDAGLTESFPTTCETPHDADIMLETLSTHARTTAFREVYPIHAWGLTPDQLKKNAWSLQQFAGDAEDDERWSHLLKAGVVQLTIAEGTIDVITSCNDLQYAVEVVRQCLGALPYAVHWEV